MVYELGGQEYKTKTSVITRCREILKNTRANTKLTGANEAFVRDLLKLHPRRGQTESVKRDLYVVYSQRSPRDKCFAYWSNRKQEPIDFSYKECISPRPALERFREGCRDAALAEVREFKQAFWRNKRSAKCPLSGVRMTYATSHVDHVDPTFAALVDVFIGELSLDISAVTYRGNAFAQQKLAQAFADFHEANAVLAVVSASANLSKGGGNYKRKVA